MADCINIIVKQFGQDTVLIGIEDDKGNTINIGENLSLDTNGLRTIRIRPEDIEKA